MLIAALTIPAAAQTVTPNLGLTIPSIGSSNWGPTINGDLGIVDNMAGGSVLVPKFNVSKLSFSSGIELTGVTGTGTSVVTNTSPVISSPTLNTSIGCGTGFKQQEVDSCTTATTANATCTTTLNWCGAAFADTSYKVTCSFGVNTFNWPYIQSIVKATDSLTITVSNVISGGLAAHGAIDCVATE